MDQWEYKVFVPVVLGNVEAEFNELGRHGWELICIYDGRHSKIPVFFFKHRIGCNE